MANPFCENAVTDPWQQGMPDLPSIHAEAFDAFREALVRIGQQGLGSTSLLLLGDAGCGKSHLLSRIRRYLQGHEQLYLFVGIRLQTSQSGFWRHVRRNMADNLMRAGAAGCSQIERLFLQRLRQLTDQRQIDANGLEALATKLSATACVSPSLCRLLIHVLGRRHLPQVRSWLRGDLLAEPSLRQLGLASGQEQIDPEEQARDFVLEICRLAGAYIPVALCFDQVEALQQAPGDTHSLHRFGEAVRLLHDCTTNLLMISCIQSKFAGTLCDMAVANYGALAAQRVTLNRLSLEQALALIRERMKASRLPEALQQACQARIVKDLQGIYQTAGRQELSARQVLTRAAALYATSLEPGQALKASSAVWLEVEHAQRQEAILSRMGPEDVDAVFLDALPAVLRLIDDDWAERPDKRSADIDLVFHGHGLDLGISLCNQRNMTSLAARLKRLLIQRETAGLDRLLLVRHPQHPIPPGARKARAYLDELRARGDRLLLPSSALLAAIQSAAELLAASQAGEFSHAQQALGAATVRDFLQQALGGEVRDFLEGLLDMRPSAAQTDQAALADLLAALDSAKVIALPALAAQLGWTAEALQALALRHPGQLGLIGAAPTVLFQRSARTDVGR